MEEERRRRKGRGNRRFSNFDKTSSSSAAFGTLNTFVQDVVEGTLADLVMMMTNQVPLFNLPALGFFCVLCLSIGINDGREASGKQRQ
eukprot:gene2011-1202_t